MEIQWNQADWEEVEGAADKRTRYASYEGESPSSWTALRRIIVPVSSAHGQRVQDYTFEDIAETFVLEEDRLLITCYGLGTDFEWPAVEELTARVLEPIERHLGLHADADWGNARWTPYSSSTSFGWKEDRLTDIETRFFLRVPLREPMRGTNHIQVTTHEYIEQWWMIGDELLVEFSFVGSADTPPISVAEAVEAVRWVIGR